MMTNNATLQQVNGFNLSSPLGDPTVPPPPPLPLPPVEPPLVPGVFVSGAGHLFQAVTGLQHFVFLDVAVANSPSFKGSYSVHPVMQVMVDFKAKHDIFSMQQFAGLLLASSLPGLNMVVPVQGWFFAFTPHLSVSSSQHDSPHEAALLEHLVAEVGAPLFFKPFFIVAHGALAHVAFAKQQLVLTFFAKSGMFAAGLTYSSAVVHGRFAAPTPHLFVSASQHVLSPHEAASLEHLVAEAGAPLFFKPFFMEAHGALAHVAFIIQQLVLTFFAKSGMFVAGVTYSSAVVHPRFAAPTPHLFVSLSRQVVSSHEAASLAH